MLRVKLLLVLFVLSMLAGCDSALRRAGEVAPGEGAEVVRQSLETRWRQSLTDLDLKKILSRFQGAGLRRTVRRAATTPLSLQQVIARLGAARKHAREARTIVAELYGYRRAGGIQLDAEEEALWARLAGNRRGEGEKLGRVEDLDLVRARQSLAVQAGKAWFYLQGVHQLYLRAVETRELRRQMVERHRTSSRLERGEKDRVMVARKDLARADARAKQLERAQKLAFDALFRISGETTLSEETGAVLPVPEGVPLAQLAQRSDLIRVIMGLEEAGLSPSWPGLELTTRGERGSRGLSGLVRLEAPALVERLGISPTTVSQEKAAREFAEGLHVVLLSVKRNLHRIRQLLTQQHRLESELQQARRKVNRLRARYSARRARLLEILEAQAVLTGIAGRAAYVEHRVQEQRLGAHFALGMP